MQLLELLQIECDPHTTDEPSPIKWTIATELKRSSGETKLIIEDRDTRATDPRPVLIKAIARGYSWNQEPLNGESTSIRALARTYGVDERHVRWPLPLALLAADFIEAIIEDRAPAELTVHQLYRKLPNSWDMQRKSLGFT
jgi:hypothetical protein